MHETAVAQIRRLLWLYFWLLIFEGALRKWVFPSLTNPLLIVRDPVVMAIYFQAFRAGLFPNNGFVKLAMMLGVVSFFVGLVAMDKSNVLVPAYGWRANFLHLPLIFIVPLVVGDAQIDRIGRWLLILAIPMAVLMVMQFRASKSDWLNYGAGGEGRQLDSMDGKIRPAGTFSFVTGTVSYLALVTTFVVRGVLERPLYSPLLVPSGLALASSLAVSGSRSAIFSAGIVIGMLGLGVFANPRLLGKSYKVLSFVLIIFLVVTSFDFFSEGMTTTTRRFEAASANENVVVRFFGGFLEPFYMITDVPLLGHGLGVGTNAGAALISAQGNPDFLLGEGEWCRVILESGPILGLAFLLLRCMIALMLGLAAYQSARRGSYVALLLFGAAMLPIINGQFGQPTTCGFAVLSAGLCLAAAQSTRTQYAPHAKESSSGNDAAHVQDAVHA